MQQWENGDYEGKIEVLVGKTRNVAWSRLELNPSLRGEKETLATAQQDYKCTIEVFLNRWSASCA